jgi:hypothetical protein
MPGSMPINIPAPLVDYQFDVSWPREINTAATGAAFDTNGYSKYGQVYGLWSAASGAATNNMGVYHSLYGGQWTSGGATTSGRTTYVAPLLIPLTKNAMAAAAQFSDLMRVFRIQVCFATVGVVNYTAASGLAIMPMAGVAPSFIAAGSPGFGIVGDGAGGWRFNASVGAGLTDTTALVWPNAVTEWTVVDFEFLSATGLSDAVFNLYLNGQQVALPATCSKWGAGTHLPDYSQTPNSAGFCLGIACGDGALAGQLNLAGLRIMKGRYRVSGAQV